MNFLLYLMMFLFLIFGTAGLIYSNGKTSKILMSIVLISFGCFIGYGLDTQCKNFAIYDYCGDVNE